MTKTQQAVELTEKLMTAINAAVNHLRDAESLLHPSLDIYNDIHDARMGLQDVYSNLELGEYDN